MAPLRHVVVDSADPFERGRQRGMQVAGDIRRTWPIYRQLFAISAHDAGRAPVDVRGVAKACLQAVTTWSPELARELAGVAAGAGVDVETVMALNARTEVFAHTRGAALTECSTVVQMSGAGGTALGAQTWDWHEELCDGWHVQTVRGDEHAFVGLAEFGMLAKIGVNDAGVGVAFNLLRHASDAHGRSGEHDDLLENCGGGVPVHLVAREVLARASTLAEAVDVICSAPVLASTVITVMTAEQAACLEISPDGVGVVDPSDCWLVHTNHFLDPHLAEGERVTQDVTTTFEREDLLRARVKGVANTLDIESLAALLCAHDEDGVPVCRHPDVDAPMGYRAATLATVGIDPDRREATISAGGPCRRTDVTTLRAGS